MFDDIFACERPQSTVSLGIRLMNDRIGATTALLKAHGSLVAEYVLREAAQIFGGLAYTRGGQGGKVERLYREVRFFAIPAGSEEVMLGKFDSKLGFVGSTRLTHFLEQTLVFAIRSRRRRRWEPRVSEVRFESRIRRADFAMFWVSISSEINMNLFWIT